MERTKIYKIIFSLVGFILMLSGVSYAYFITKVSNNETTSTIASDAANLELEFKEGTNQISASDIFPGWYASKTFTVTNKSSIAVNYSLYISDIVNPLIGDSLSYKIESLDGGFNKNKTLLPSSEEVIGTGIYIQGNTTHTYTVTTYYNNLDVDQSADKGKTFSYKIYIKSTNESLLAYNYTGNEQTFNVPFSGYYKLEVWGAQGGGDTTYVGGYGGYSSGEIYLNKNDKVYINVGGQGGSNNTETNIGGYNGGGYSGNGSGYYSFGGGGATSIAKTSGTITSIGESNLNEIIMIAGGGGGAVTGSATQGGSGGGYIGGSGTAPSTSSWNTSTYIPIGGSQTGVGYAYQATIRQGAFGTGHTSNTNGWGGGGGGGLYGGSNGHGTTGAGGSGYIDNSSLTNKVMYCYNCSESSDESTKTISTTCASESPTENCAKKGNGYTKITYIDYEREGLQLLYDATNNTGSGYNSSSTIWKDLSGNDNDATINGAVWSNNGLLFDGSNDYASIGILNYNTYTLEAVIMPTESVTGEHDIINNYQSGGYGLALNSNNVIKVGFYNKPTSSYKTVSSKTKYSINETYAISGTYDGNSLNIYVNGILENTLSVSGIVGVPTNNTIMMLGANPYGASPQSGYYFPGYMYSIRLYSRALTIEEIIHNYNLDKSRFNI